MDIENLANATINFDQSEVNQKVNTIRQKVDAMEKNVRRDWLLKAISFIDLTTLGSDDTPAKVEALCQKAVNPIKSPTDTIQDLHTASVYVYPLRFADMKSALDKLDKEHKVLRCTVGGGFPSGQYLLETRLREVEIDIELGADEIDIVINRPLVLMQQWKELYEELKLFRTVCSNKVCLKVILATGELGNFQNIYKASMIAMMAGADFIKTSTGKEAINATLPVGIIMAQAIKDYYKQSKKKVGLKPAGGLKDSTEALGWMMLVQMELGNEWLTKDLFRLGASGLLDNIVEKIQTM